MLAEGGGKDLLGVLEIQDVKAGGLHVWPLNEAPGPGVTSQGEKLLVELVVVHDIGFLIVLPDGQLLQVQGVQQLPGGLLVPLRQAAQHLALQHMADEDDLPDQAQVDGGHKGAALGIDIHQVLLTQQQQRLPDGGAADFQFLRQLHVRDGAAGFEFQIKDAVPKDLKDLLLGSFLSLIHHILLLSQNNSLQGGGSAAPCEKIYLILIYQLQQRITSVFRMNGPASGRKRAATGKRPFRTACAVSALPRGRSPAAKARSWGGEADLRKDPVFSKIAVENSGSCDTIQKETADVSGMPGAWDGAAVQISVSLG